MKVSTSHGSTSALDMTAVACTTVYKEVGKDFLDNF